MLQHKCETVVLLLGVLLWFFWGEGGGCCLFVCLFTVRALKCISNSIFVQTGEGSLYCSDSKSTPYSPAMYGLAQGEDSRVCCRPGHYRASSHCIFVVSLRKMHYFQQDIKITPIPLTYSFCWLKFIKVPEIYLPLKKVTVQKKISSHASVVYSIDFLLLYLW